MNNLASLPDEMAHLSSLVSLELSDNRLSQLPSAAVSGLKGLQFLGLRSNCLTELPTELGQLTGLTHLDASMNHITVSSSRQQGLEHCRPPLLQCRLTTAAAHHPQPQHAG